MLIDAYETIPDFFNDLVPEYKSKTYKSFLVSISEWEDRFSPKILDINEDRASKRLAAYVPANEVGRVRERLKRGKDSSIRFGVSKEGTGYHGERGDFCLVGGAIERRNLTLFYRSLELIGGFAYDVVLIDTLGQMLDIKWKSVTFHAARANVFALKRNSNEKLYPKLKRIFK